MRPKTYVQEKRETKAQGKVQRLRPGVVPQWARKDQPVAQADQSQTALKVTGLTADAAAVIIDTSKGLKHSEIQQQVLENQSYESQSQDEKPQVIGDESSDEQENAVISDTDNKEIAVPQQHISSSDESDSDSSNRLKLDECRPIFLKKEDRELLFQSEAKQKEDERREQELELKLTENRQKEVESLVQQSLVQDQNQTEKLATNYDSDDQLPFVDKDDNDEEYCKSELAQELWKARELKRILRDRQMWEAVEQEQKDIERRRAMTEEQRIAENEREGLKQKEQKVAYNFMQRYYHKGAFQPSNLTAQEEAVLNRDYNMPTGEDKMDKSVLTQFYQKRTGQVGRKGQSKYTHLNDQDTTNFNPQTRVSDQIANKFTMRSGGYKAAHELERPSQKRRRF